MTKAELIERLALSTGSSKQATTVFLDTLCELAHFELQQIGEFKIHGLASFKTQLRPARDCRNPATGEKMVSPEKLVTKVKALHPLNNL